MLVVKSVFVEQRVAEPEHERLEPIQRDRGQVEGSESDVVVLYLLAVLLQALLWVAAIGLLVRELLGRRLALDVPTPHLAAAHVLESFTLPTKNPKSAAVSELDASPATSIMTPLMPLS